LFIPEPAVPKQLPTILERCPARFDPLAISIDSAVDFLGLPRSTIVGLVADGELETILIGKRRLILYPSAVKFIAKQPLAPMTEDRREQGRALVAARYARGATDPPAPTSTPAPASRRTRRAA
jgi:hypothetical protein